MSGFIFHDIPEEHKIKDVGHWGPHIINDSLHLKASITGSVADARQAEKFRVAFGGQPDNPMKQAQPIGQAQQPSTQNTLGRSLVTQGFQKRRAGRINQ